MLNMRLLIKKHKIFLWIFLLFAVLKIFSLFVAHDVWWDSSVFLGMGKYIYSLGETGLWESSRPLIWPLILGFFWKLNLDYVLFGKLLVIFFSLGVLILTYLIAYELFNEKIAVVASLFLSLSSTFFLFGNVLHAEIPSAFFVLLGFYFFVKKSYRYSGLFLGIAFMTRFFQILAFVPLFLLLIYWTMKKKENVKSLIIFSIFFIIPIAPYLILNHILYNNILYPFLLQSYMTKYTGWIFSQPFYFYFTELVKENILVLFSVLALIFIFKKPDFKKISLVVTFLFIFVPYNLIAHKEMRFLIAALPFLYILTSYGIFYFIGFFNKNMPLILFLLLIIFLILSAPKLRFDRYEDNLDVFYSYIENEKIGNGLWISNPSFIAYSNNKASELIYYPLYNSEKVDYLISNINNAKYILIDTCDLLPCPPFDGSCNQKHNDFINLLKNRFNLDYYSEYGSCKYYIFRAALKS